MASNHSCWEGKIGRVLVCAIALRVDRDWFHAMDGMVGGEYCIGGATGPHDILPLLSLKWKTILRPIPRSPSRRPTRALRAVTFNLHAPKTFSAITDVLKTADADVIFLQEVPISLHPSIHILGKSPRACNGLG